MIATNAQLLQTASTWQSAGRKVAVAWVIETWGSAPRPVGSVLVIDADGAMEGSVSGGCVEGAVLVEALEAMEDNMPRVLEYGVSDDEAFAVGLACGGRIRVLVDPMTDPLKAALLSDLAQAAAEGRAIAYVADLTVDRRELAGSEDFPDRFRLDQSGIEPDGQTFVAVLSPPLRMIIVGAVHIAQHLTGMARAAGFLPIIVDPRSAFGSPDRFPGETIVEEWPDAALKALAPDHRTAVVTLTHDPKLDDPAIMETLRGRAFYLGCLGSRRTHAKRVGRLAAAGFEDADIARIHAPVGLDLGGRAPGEIAVSIIAQVVQILRGQT